MKNVFRGLSAKLALALLAVGTLSSCYEKEELDQPAGSGDKAPQYFIQGNVTAAKDGKGLQANVTLNGASVNVSTDGYFTEKAGEGTFKIVATMDNYFDASRTVTFYEAPKNSVTIATVDIAMYDASQAVETPTINVPASTEEAKKAADVAQPIIAEALKALGVNTQTTPVKVEVADDGTAKVQAVVVVDKAAVGEAKTVDVPSFAGFASTITPEDDNIFTRGVTQGQIWIASAEAALGLTYGLRNTIQKVTLPGKAGQAISGYDLVINLLSRTLEFNGATGSVMYQEKITVTPKYESHDSHDSHDSHNGHGTNPGAGGGASQGE